MSFCLVIYHLECMFVSIIIIITVFTRLNAVAFWNFEQAGGDGIYSRAVFIITFLQYAPAVL